MFSIEQIQEDVIAYLDSSLAQPIYEMAIPDPETVLRNEVGDIDPYVSYQFRVPYEGTAKSMIGPRGDDYNVVIQVQTVAPIPRLSRKISNKVVNVMVGAKFDWAGQIRLTLGGPTVPLVSSTGATEAYVVPMAFRIPAQFAEV